MADDDTRRLKMVTAAAEAQAAWHRLYDRALRLEFDGYAGVDADLFPRVMETLLRAYRAEPPRADRSFEILRQLYDQAVAEIDRTQPRRT